jgi:uncharacterized OB-fold protein
LCPACLSVDVSWREVSGDGTVWSVAEYHRAYSQRYAAEVPYQCILVELDCGPRMISRFVSESDAKAYPGQRVRAVRAELSSGRSIPCFEEGEQSC